MEHPLGLVLPIELSNTEEADRQAGLREGGVRIIRLGLEAQLCGVGSLSRARPTARVL